MSMRIAVIGAGIAGLTTALALHRAGLACRVYEQAGRLGPVGAGIQLAPNASKLLHRLGLRDELMRTAARPRALRRRRWRDGQVLGHTVLGQHCVELYGAPYYTMHRADLHRMLADALPEGTVRLGSSCVGVETGDVTAVRFATGAAERADVVIGADGIHSVVRQSLVIDTPRFTGEAIYRGLVPRQDVPFRDEEIVSWLGPGRHCVCYPVSAGRSFAFSATVPAAHGAQESWSAQGSRAELTAAYADWHDDVRQLFDGAELVGKWALYDRDPVAWTGADRTTLAGDAAHPMLPTLAQGANQAIEDAVVLARCLAASTPAGAPGALRRYEKARRQRTSAIQASSRSRATVAHLPDSAEQHRRDTGLRGADELRDRAWIYGYDAEKATL
ncbi:FAD-dependent monooxygenase [Amycolatopsis pithecellobii]|uniref:NAD(P)-binding protein n=1 Tax=Amycolatopsis pithecellobii TaxID=664692 RepID=A0A6N7YKA7_9PSEU|nr:FAD-dependent monooxygenase [Amycolatopsis pithecellobii]MTD53345.1 NAD(P)-binding protein [Amycolatopsis pithecellobii]